MPETASEPLRRKCSAVNAAGKPCGAWPKRGKDLCPAHLGETAIAQDPVKTAKRKALVRREKAREAEMKRLSLREQIAHRAESDRERIMERLWSLVFSDNEQVALRGLDILLDRYLGKPLSDVNVNVQAQAAHPAVSEYVQTLSREERMALARERLGLPEGDVLEGEYAEED